MYIILAGMLKRNIVLNGVYYVRTIAYYDGAYLEQLFCITGVRKIALNNGGL